MSISNLHYIPISTCHQLREPWPLILCIVNSEDYQ